MINDDIKVKPFNGYHSNAKRLIDRIIYLDDAIAQRVIDGRKFSYFQEEIYAILWIIIRLGFYEEANVDEYINELSPSLQEDYLKVKEKALRGL